MAFFLTVFDVNVFFSAVICLPLFARQYLCPRYNFNHYKILVALACVVFAWIHLNIECHWSEHNNEITFDGGFQLVISSFGMSHYVFMVWPIGKNEGTFHHAYKQTNNDCWPNDGAHEMKNTEKTSHVKVLFFN